MIPSNSNTLKSSWRLAKQLDDPPKVTILPVVMATAQIAPGGQVALPLNIAGQLRLRDGRPASLVQVEIRDDGVFLRPLEPRDIPADTLRQWIAEGESEMGAFRKGAA